MQVKISNDIRYGPLNLLTFFFCFYVLFREDSNTASINHLFVLTSYDSHKANNILKLWYDVNTVWVVI